MANTASIDQVLHQAVAAGDVPGVVAVSADDRGVVYQGAFGRRSLASDDAMSLDTVFRIASMTKAITATAAMQMVEQGKLALDQPAGEVLPELANPMVLEGFDDAGKPVLRPARKQVTLRRLLTHTAGFVYDTWNANQARYAEVTGLPAARTGKREALNAPLGFEPGERWEYGINIDWAGRMVEAVSGQNLEAYMQQHIFEPLGMRDSSFDPRPDWRSRTVQVHSRQANGSLEPIDTPPPPADREFYPGGGGLFSTAPDYIAFLQMLLNGGAYNGARVLQGETVALMAQNHMGDLDVLPLTTFKPAFSNDAEFFPGMSKKWGLSFLINTEDAPTGRSAGSLAWAGINNTYFWLDLKKRVAGVLMTQILPFADPTVLGLLDRFEAAVYG
ncbi:MAG: serine hydrolase domain-containing protein [Acetobacteraceae bacterium]|jgi:CubicO group peptidase (beta-lactamase class C family)